MVAILAAAAVAAEAGMLVASHRAEVVAGAEVVVAAGMAGIKSISQRKAVSRFEFEPNVQTDNDS